MDDLSGMVEVRVDDRNRVAVPSKFVDAFRKIASESGENGSSADDTKDGLDVVLSLDLQKRLSIWPKNVYEEFMDFLKSKPKFDPKWQKVRGFIQGSTERLKLDKQNRLKIPALLGRQLGLVGEIVITGTGDHLQLVSKEKWEKELNDFERTLDEVMAEERMA